MSVKVITKFPDMDDFSYNYRRWNRQFVEQNIILNGKFSYLYYPEHWTTLSLKFAFGGCEQYILGNMKYAVEDSMFLILNRDSIYQSLINSHKPVESLTLNFTAKFVEDVFYSSFNTDEYLLDFPEVRDKHPVNFFQKLYHTDKVLGKYVSSIRSTLNSRNYDSDQLTEILHGILEHTFRSQLSTSKKADELSSVKRSTRIELFNRLNKAKDYIESNYHEAIDLDMLAKVSSLCPHHFLRKFKSYTGVSPYQYLKSVRLEKARIMLESTNSTVTEICMNCGYESLSSFSYLFKNTYKTSPENYRSLMKKKSIFK
ncbi:MAG TPA: AraC family transcriptional regulator [Ignavibacteria bacterium]|nr:AraC family transcriptional regulator [Ignavibacteria bacterium]